MSNYTTLKTTINANIRQNGNQEITGKILNSVLNAMVNTLGEGYQFAGIATTETDPGTPDAKVFFIANGKGEYAHFWALDVTEDDVVFLVWDNAWHKVATGIAADAQLKEAMTELAEIAGKVDTKQDIIPDLDAIREGAGKGSTALQKESDPVYLADRPSLLLAIDGKVSKEPGKGLSHNDFTDTEKAKLAGLENYDDTEVRELIDEKANEAADKFNAAIVQEIGDSQDKVMSQKAVTDALIASDQKLSELESKTSDIKNSIQDLDGDTFYVTDAKGNIVAKIDADGVKAIEVIAQGKKLSEMPDASDMKIKSILDDFYKEEFYITDGQGNVAFKVTKDGIEYINRPIYETSPFRGQEFFTIGDSLCNSNEWQERFCQIKGAKFNAILNTNHYTKGGTKTLDLSGQCGMDRIRLLLEEQPNAKFIFMQNVNDSGSKIGTITDVPFMAQHNIIYQGQTFTTKADALAAKMSAVNAISHNVGTLLRIPYGVHGKLLRIGSGATNSGTILITLNGVQFGVSVNAGDNVYKVAQAILNWDYSSININDTQHITDGVVDGVVFSDTTGTGVIPSVSFNTGSTGVSLSLENSESVSYVGYCFVSYDINDWNDETKWVEWNTISLCSLYKGIIEYTITHFPTAYFAWIAFPHMGYNQNTVAKRADGSYDWDECIKNGYPLYDAQKACCDRMRVPMYNVLYNAGMNVYNFFTYWPNANVHPYKSGYYRWGECLARLVE